MWQLSYFHCVTNQTSNEMNRYPGEERIFLDITPVVAASRFHVCINQVRPILVPT
jgi:hypothetical protein